MNVDIQNKTDKNQLNYLTLQISDLNVFNGESHILRNVDLSVKRG